jgi:hypothetical protein
MEGWDRADQEPAGAPSGRADPSPTPDKSRSPHTRRRRLACGRWRRHEGQIPGSALEDWEILGFYECFDEPRP